MKELSDYYFISEFGLCCFVEEKIYLVIGVMQEGSFIYFQQRLIEANK